MHFAADAKRWHRHLAEESDAVVLIVSEETGNISIAMDERLLSGLSLEEVENILKAAFRPQPSV
jgi:hypothetical protein